MARQIVLLCLDSTVFTDGRFDFAVRLVKANKAHLRGIATAELPFRSSVIHELSGTDPVIIAKIKMLNQRANNLLQSFEQAAKKAKITSFDSVIVDNDDEKQSMGVYGRFADFVIVKRSNFAKPRETDDLHFPETMMQESGRPVLVLPPKLSPEQMDCQNVAIAWDASRVVARAVTNALPILKKAKRIRVLMFNVQTDFKGDIQNPGHSLKNYLMHHGVDVELIEPQNVKDVGAAILSYCADNQIDLLVQGGYCTSRLREFFLGGVTSTILMESPIPVLMSH